MLTSASSRSRAPTALLALASMTAALAVGLSACTPASAPAATPTARAVVAASPSPVAAASPASNARPAPTPGGVPPTVVGRAAPVAAAPSPSPASIQPPVAVRITITANGTFDPPQATVNRGDTVQWVNAGRSPQTVTANPALAQNAANVALPAGVQPWDSGVINASQSYIRTFDTPGTYRYVSLPDEMQGTVGEITVQG